MNKEEIMKSLIGRSIPEKLARKFASRFKSKEDAEDYVQEMYLAILETMEKRQQQIDNLYNEGKIYDYFARICLNQIVNKKSKFNREYETNINKVELENENYGDDSE